MQDYQPNIAFAALGVVQSVNRTKFYHNGQPQLRIGFSYWSERGEIINADAKHYMPSNFEVSRLKPGAVFPIRIMQSRPKKVEMIFTVTKAEQAQIDYYLFRLGFLSEERYLIRTNGQSFQGTVIAMPPSGRLLYGEPELFLKVLWKLSEEESRYVDILYAPGELFPKPQLGDIGEVFFLEGNPEKFDIVFSGSLQN